MERKITGLKVQKRNPNRVNVYLDGEYAFALARLVAAWLSVGQSLSEKKIESLRAEDILEKGFQQAIRLLSYRPRSEAEIARRLTAKGFDQATIESILVRLKSSDLAGDAQFAQTWVDNRITFRPRSQRMLRYELRQKGVEEKHINNALTSVTDDSELAYRAGINYGNRLVNLDEEHFRKRLGAYLARRGFAYGTIAPVIRQIWEELRQESD